MILYRNYRRRNILFTFDKRKIFFSRVACFYVCPSDFRVLNIIVHYRPQTRNHVFFSQKKIVNTHGSLFCVREGTKWCGRKRAVDRERLDDTHGTRIGRPRERTCGFVAGILHCATKLLGMWRGTSSVQNIVEKVSDFNTAACLTFRHLNWWIACIIRIRR